MAVPARKPEKAAGEFADFDTSQLLATHEQHEKNITSLTQRVAKIEGKLSTPQALAAFFKESAKDSRNLEGVFAEMFCRFMNENPAVKDAFKKKMDEVDRNFFFKTCKRLWLPIYTFVLVIVTIIGQHLAEWLVSLFPHK